MEDKKIPARMPTYESGSAFALRAVGLIGIACGMFFDRDTVVLGSSAIFGASYARELVDYTRGYFLERLDIERARTKEGLVDKTKVE
ncbi:MAG: hypothetical protein AABX35_02415 [Nanoarchaeota archaeon]